MSAQHDLDGVPMWWHPHALAHVSREAQNASHHQQEQATTSINKESQ